MKWLLRILGGIVVLIVLCVAGLWLYGMRPSHGHTSDTVVINRPAARVWQYITDDNLLKKWIGGLGEIEHLTPGKMGAGEKLRIVESYKDTRTTMDMTVGRFTPPHEITLDISADGFTEHAGYLLEEQGSGQTKLTLDAQTDYHGFLYRLLEPLITSAADKKVQGDLQRLKTLVEAEPAGG